MHFPRHLLISLIILYFVGCTISFSSIVSRIDYSFHAEDRNSLTLLSQVLTQFHERWNISLVFLSCDCKVDSYLSVAASVSSSCMTPIAILCKGYWQYNAYRIHLWGVLFLIIMYLFIYMLQIRPANLQEKLSIISSDNPTVCFCPSQPVNLNI